MRNIEIEEGTYIPKFAARDWHLNWHKNVIPKLNRSQSLIAMSEHLKSVCNNLDKASSLSNRSPASDESSIHEYFQGKPFLNSQTHLITSESDNTKWKIERRGGGKKRKRCGREGKKSWLQLTVVDFQPETIGKGSPTIKLIAAKVEKYMALVEFRVLIFSSSFGFVWRKGQEIIWTEEQVSGW